MALRVLGVIEVMAGDLDEGVARCQQAVNEPVAPHRRALAVAYQANALLLAGRAIEVVEVALDGAALAQRAGFATSFGAFLSGFAAHALIRLGRWDEAEVVLGGMAGLEPVMVGAVQLDTAAAVLAARRGDSDRANALLVRLATSPSDPWHDAEVASSTVAVLLAQRRWHDAMTVAANALAPPPGADARLTPQLTAGYVVAAVEQALDARARKVDVDVDAVAADVRRRLATAYEDPTASTPISAADLAFADAMLTRLTGANAEAFARAADAAELAGDRWLQACARAQEADAAVMAGDASRAVGRLRAAYQTAVELRAQPLLSDIEAIARRSRIGLDAPAVQAVGQQDAVRLGLTSREAEVLALVAAGRTNREIGAQLYVSEKTASVHVSNILRKLNVSSRVEAAAIAQRVGVA
jgi:DNA-binding CsgD family transcriptional regulator